MRKLETTAPPMCSHHPHLISTALVGEWKRHKLTTVSERSGKWKPFSLSDLRNEEGKETQTHMHARRKNYQLAAPTK